MIIITDNPDAIAPNQDWKCNSRLKSSVQHVWDCVIAFVKYQTLTFGQQGVEGAEPQRVMWKMEQEPTSLLDGFQAQKNL